MHFWGISKLFSSGYINEDKINEDKLNGYYNPTTSKNCKIFNAPTAAMLTKSFCWEELWWDTLSSIPQLIPFRIRRTRTFHSSVWEQRRKKTVHFPNEQVVCSYCLQWLKWNCSPRPPPSVCWQARHTTSPENAGYQWVHWSLKIKSKSLVSFREGNVFPATPKRVSTHCAPPMLCVLSPRPQTRFSGLLVDTKISFFLFSHTDHAIIQGFRKMQHETRREEKLVGLGWTISKKILPCPRIACYLAL